MTREKKMYLIETVSCLCGKNWDVFVDRSGVEYILESGVASEPKISDSTCPNCGAGLFQGWEGD